MTVSKLRSMQNLKLNKKKIITRLCKHTHEKPGYSYCTYMVPPVSITAGLTTCLASTHKQKKKVNIVLSALSWAINCKVYSNRGHQTFCLPDAILWTLACDVCKRIMNCRVVYHLDRCIHWCHEGWKSQDQSSLACGALLVSSENPVDQAEISFQAHLRKAVQETSDPAHTKHEKYCNYTKCNNTSYIINSWCY